MGPGNRPNSRSPEGEGTVRNQGGGGLGGGHTTHAVVASFVVLVLGFYMNGEFRQKGTLRGEKIKFH